MTRASIEDPTRREKGFTLVEMLVAVTIIGLLAAIAIPNLFSALNRSKQVSTEATLRGYGVELARYVVDNGGYPAVDNVDDLLAALSPCRLPANDAWGHPFDYGAFLPMKPTVPLDSSSAYTSYSLQSLGSDGIDGSDINRENRNIYTLDLVYVDGRFEASIEE